MRENVVLHQYGDHLIELCVQSCGKIARRDRVAERNLQRTVQWSLQNLWIERPWRRIASRLRGRELFHKWRCARLAKIHLCHRSVNDLCEMYRCWSFVAFVAKHDSWSARLVV